MAKVFSYDFERMLELLEIERECVKRAKTCDRNCAACDLVQKDEDLLEMYDKVIRLVSREVDRVKREKAYKEKIRAERRFWIEHPEEARKAAEEEEERQRWLDFEMDCYAAECEYARGLRY